MNTKENTHTGPQAQEAGEKALAMALQHIRICAPDPTVEAALEAIDLKALATPARVVSDGDFRSEIQRISEDYDPCSEGEAMQALCQMREALQESLSRHPAGAAGEVCDECGGSGLVSFKTFPGGIEVDNDDQPCPSCAERESRAESLPNLPEPDGFIKRSAAANSYNRNEPYYFASTVTAYTKRHAARITEMHRAANKRADGLEKDAGRYRVIRDAVINGCGAAFDLFMEEGTPLTAEAMDALCDAAIDTALQPGQGEENA